MDGGGYLARLTGSGALDLPQAFPVQTMDGQVFDLFLQPDGKILVSGISQIFDGSGNPLRRGIARFSANGLAGWHLYPESYPAQWRQYHVNLRYGRAAQRQDPHPGEFL